MGKVYICITVDWEGEHLNNVEELISIRKKIGSDIPFSHFICPNYFTSYANPVDNAKAILSAIEPIDEVGLHIHCYKDLIKSIPGLLFKTDNNYHNTLSWFEKKIVKKVLPAYNRSISGRGVPLSTYTKNEIEKIISKSKELLCDSLILNNISGFRAGGWIANDTVLEIVAKLGFLYDSSAVAPSILSQGYTHQNRGDLTDDYGDKNGIFTDHILDLWGYQQNEGGFLKNKNILQAQNCKAIQITSQPYQVNSLYEIPNNCGLSDFCTVEKTVFPLIKCYIKNIELNPELSFLIVYGCHQEGDYQYKKELLNLFSSLSKIDSSFIKFIRMNEVSALNLSDNNRD